MMMYILYMRLAYENKFICVYALAKYLSFSARKFEVQSSS